MREQVQKKNQLEDKVRKVNMARMQIRRQLEDLNATAEPEVQNVHYLVGIRSTKKTLNEILVFNVINDNTKNYHKLLPL